MHGGPWKDRGGADSPVMMTSSSSPEGLHPNQLILFGFRTMVVAVDNNDAVRQHAFHDRFRV